MTALVADGAGWADVLAPLQDSLRGLWIGLVALIPNMTAALILVVLFRLIGRLLGRAVRIAARRAHLARELAELFGSATSALITVLGFLFGAVVVFPDFTPGNLVAGLGITSVAVGFAFKDILQNFFAGILILWRRPFRIGDEIRSGEFEGKVEEITTRSTRIHTYDGERVVLPNAEVYTRAILVRTAYPLRRVRFMIGVGYSESIEETRELVYRTLANTEGVLVDPGPWVYVAEMASSSINFAVYFWTQSSQANVLAVTDRVASAIKLALDRAGIEIPYPHSVVILRDARDLSAGAPEPQDFHAR